MATIPSAPNKIQKTGTILSNSSHVNARKKASKAKTSVDSMLEKF